MLIATHNSIIGALQAKFAEKTVPIRYDCLQKEIDSTQWNIILIKSNSIRIQHLGAINGRN